MDRRGSGPMGDADRIRTRTLSRRARHFIFQERNVPHLPNIRITQHLSNSAVPLWLHTVRTSASSTSPFGIIPAY
jgi:hypothetical protein